jgi:uncharacterized protein YdhG (YjbR/CyaY superfamily)
MQSQKNKVENIEQYISPFPKDIKSKLVKLRKTIKKIVPNAVETISYGMPTFKLNGKNLVHFAAYQNHIGFYPTPSGVSAFKKELSKYKTSKGAVQFPIDMEIPHALVEKIVRHRVRQVLQKN